MAGEAIGLLQSASRETKGAEAEVGWLTTAQAPGHLRPSFGLCGNPHT